MRPLTASILLHVLFCAHAAVAQETPIRAPGLAETSGPVFTHPAPAVWRSGGTDAWSGVRYVRVLLVGNSATDSATNSARDLTTNSAKDSAAEPDLRQPTLTGQCTQDAKGKLHFELFANFGGLTDAAFYPPWHATDADSFPPRTSRVALTMEFLGYTKVKPLKRQFEQVTAPGPDQLRYLNPGGGSPNMEPPGWIFQYLRALPTLRISREGHGAQFATEAWLRTLHQEPLCAASGA